MAISTLKSQAFKLKGRLHTLTVLSILDTDVHFFSQQLTSVIAQAPKLFNQAPIIFDCSEIDIEQFELLRFCQCAREQGLIPVAVQGGNPALEALAQYHGLAILHASSSQDKPLQSGTSSQEATSTVADDRVKNRFVTTPVRSGQQVVSKADLVIVSSVSHGAELLADGHIHVYGALRGRALAGISGDRNARIFCQSLEAELLSIAGFYRLSDSIKPMHTPCQIFLQDEHIQIEPL